MLCKLNSGIDLVAAETKYHKPCYNSYVRILYQKKGSTETKYEASFDVFLDYVKMKIFAEGKVVFLKHLLSKFRQTVKNVENQDFSYTSARLKKRLQESLPGLIFQRPSTRSISEIVFAEEMPLGDYILSDVELELSDGEESDDSDSDSDSDHSEDNNNNRYRKILFLYNYYNF